MTTINRWVVSTLLFTAMGFVSLAHGATVTYSGTLSIIDVDTGTGTYAGATVGDSFSGSFIYGDSASEAASILPFPPDSNDYNFVGLPYNGFISDGMTVMGNSEGADIYIANDEPLDADEAALINSLGLEVLEGTVVDMWSADSLSAGAYYDNFYNLMDGASFGIALISLDTNLYTDSTFKVRPPALADVDLAFFFIEEVDEFGDPVFSGYGILDSVSFVPIPAAVWLFGSGLIGLIGIARRKKI